MSIGFGNSYLNYLEGVSSYISNTDPRPISLSVHLHALNNGVTHWVFTNNNTSNPRMGFAVRSGSPDKLSLYSGGYVDSSNFTLGTGTYTQIGMTWDTDDSVEFFVDGVSMGTTTKALGGTASIGSFFGSLDGENPGFDVDGHLGDFGIWNTILSANEFASHAKGVSANRIRSSSLAGYIPMQNKDAPIDFVKGEELSVFGTLTSENPPPVNLLTRLDKASFFDVEVLGASITSNQLESGDTQSSDLQNVVQLLGNQNESGDTQSSNLITLITLLSNQLELGDSQTSSLINLLTLSSNQLDQGDSQVASLVGVLSSTLTATQQELGDTQSGNLQTIVQLLSAQLESGDIQSASMVSQLQALLTANQLEVGDIQASSLQNIIQILSTQLEVGDSQLADIVGSLPSLLIANQLETGDSQLSNIIPLSYEPVQPGVSVLDVGSPFFTNLYAYYSGNADLTGLAGDQNVMSSNTPEFITQVSTAKGPAIRNAGGSTSPTKLFAGRHPDLTGNQEFTFMHLMTFVDNGTSPERRVADNNALSPLPFNGFSLIVGQNAKFKVDGLSTNNEAIITANAITPGMTIWALGTYKPGETIKIWQRQDQGEILFGEGAGIPSGTYLDEEDLSLAGSTSILSATADVLDFYSVRIWKRALSVSEVFEQLQRPYDMVSDALRANITVNQLESGDPTLAWFGLPPRGTVFKANVPKRRFEVTT